VTAVLTAQNINVLMRCEKLMKKRSFISLIVLVFSLCIKSAVADMLPPPVCKETVAPDGTVTARCFGRPLSEREKAARRERNMRRNDIFRVDVVNENDVSDRKIGKNGAVPEKK
jgi:hypothetical protein